MQVLVIILTALFGLIAWYYKKYHEQSSLVKDFPGPPLVPFFGNALMFLNMVPSEFINLSSALIRNHGKTIRIMIGPKIQFLVTDPKDVEVILGSQKLIDKSDEYDFITEWLGTGLLIATGEKWFKRRKVITPTFHFKILEQFVEVFDKHSATFVEILAKTKGQSIDVFPLVGLCALDIISGMH